MKSVSEIPRLDLFAQALEATVSDFRIEDLREDGTGPAWDVLFKVYRQFLARRAEQ